MDLRQINQFLAVAETLNFRQAAERLHMAQPPLSMAIRRMEDAIGAPLFLRGRRGVALTDVGRAILEDAKRVKFHAEQLKRSTETALTGASGALRVAFVGSATYTLLPRVLPKFRRLHPGVALELREGTTTQILKDVATGHCDVGLIRYPVSEPFSARLDVVETDMLSAVLRADSPLARRKRLALTDLVEEPFVMYSATSAANLRAHVMSLCQLAGFTPQVAQEAVQVQTLVSLVESGMGVALLPSRACRVASKRVVFRPILPQSEMSSVAIAMALHKTNCTRTAERFAEVLLTLRE